MKEKNAVLEYLVAKQNSRKQRWGFRFKSARGDVLMESGLNFDSKTQAEQGFVSMLKSIATNQYSVQAPAVSGRGTVCAT